jgi:hypothetical protein
MNRDHDLVEIERRIGFFISYQRKLFLANTKNNVWSQAEFIKVTQPCQFYDVPVGESMCSRATLIQLEKGRRIKDPNFYVFFLCKLGIHYRWLEIKMLIEEQQKRNRYEAYLKGKTSLFLESESDEAQEILSFINHFDNQCLEFCLFIRQKTDLIDEELWLFWVKRLHIIHSSLSLTLSELLSVELYLNQNLYKYADKYIAYLKQDKILSRHNDWMIKAFTNHSFDLPNLTYAHPSKIKRVNENYYFRLIGQAKLEFITKYKRFRKHSCIQEPYPYIQTQIAMFMRTMIHQHHFDIDLIFHEKQHMSK